jgi:hypothetical protein
MATQKQLLNSDTLPEASTYARSLIEIPSLQLARKVK